ncbi:MAG: YihY/virulence factor BrkB family protein [Pseudomonadota bacterium]
MSKAIAADGHAPRHPGPRGRYAAAPSQIPFAGWKDVFWRVLSEFSNDRIMLVAAGITYYLLLALVPSLTALVSLFSLFADPVTIGAQIQQLNAIIPGGAINIIDEQLQRLTSQDNTALSFAFILSLGVALWSTNAGVKALFDGMNVAYDETEERGFIKLTAVSLSFTLILVVSAMIAAGVMIVLPVAFAFIGMDQNTELLVQILGFAVLLLLISLLLATLYRWGPSRDAARWRWITPGSVFTTFAIIMASAGFSFYVANFGSYNATYGSLGAIIGFMTWIWICTTLVLLGAEINAELEAQTKLDTTKCAPEKMGIRDAHAADNLGKPAQDVTVNDQDIEPVNGAESTVNSSRDTATRSHEQEQGSNWGLAALALPVAASLTWLAIKKRR